MVKPTGGFSTADKLYAFALFCLIIVLLVIISRLEGEVKTLPPLVRVEFKTSDAQYAMNTLESLCVIWRASNKPGSSQCAEDLERTLITLKSTILAFQEPDLSVTKSTIDIEQ